jgi:hypothetical protein
MFLCKATECDSISLLLARLGATAMALRGRYVIDLDPKWEESTVLYQFLMEQTSSLGESLIDLFKQPLIDFVESEREKHPHRGKPSELSAPKTKAAMEKDERKRIIEGANHASFDEEDDGYEECDDDITSRAELIFEAAAKARRDIDAVAGKYLDESEEPITLFVSPNPCKVLRAKLYRQGGSLSIFEPSANSFINLLCNSKADFDIFWDCYKGKRTSDGDSKIRGITINHPAINIFYLVQQEFAAQIYKSDKLRGANILSLFLPYFCGNPQFVSIDPKEKSHPSENRYAEMIRRILANTFTQKVNNKPIVCTVTPEAYQAAMTFKGELFGYSQNPQKSHMAAALVELHHTAVRLAFILHASRYWHDQPEERLIGKDDMMGGIQIARASIPHIDYAFSTSGLVAYHNARRLMAWIKRNDYYDFDLRKLSQDFSMEKKDILPALELLEKCNCLYQLATPRGSRICIVNPQLWYHR